MNGEFAKLASILKPLVLDPVRNAEANVRMIVDALGVEPKPGFVADELTVALNDGIDVELALRNKSRRVTGQEKGRGIAIVRVNGEIVFRQNNAQGNPSLTPGAWQAVIEAKANTLLETELQKESFAGGIPVQP